MASTFSKLYADLAKHAVAGSSELAATTNGRIYNIKITSDLDNGSIVGKGAYTAFEYYAMAEATAFTGTIIDTAANGNFYVKVDTATNAYLLLNVPIIYEEYTTKLKHESNFYNANGDIVRAYELQPGDIFELSKEGFVGTPTKGATLTMDTTNKYTIKVA